LPLAVTPERLRLTGILEKIRANVDKKLDLTA
jgi:hypothetical protein